jgi:hypothetical protein
LDVKSLPDLNNAVTHFLESFRHLRHLPFLKNDEAGRLYGEEVTAALAELDEYNRQNQICAHCQQRCCLRVKCEFYDAGFSRCLVEAYRPSLCRLHFCEKYASAHGPLIRILGDIYLESLLAAQTIDRGLSAQFDCPAFKPRASHLVDRISLIVDEIRLRKISEPEGCRQIQNLIDPAV